VNTRGSLAGKIVLVCLCLGIIFFFAQESVAQFEDITLSFNAGTGYLPLKDWKDFSSQFFGEKLEKDKLGTYLDLRLVIHLPKKLALAVDLEKINISASQHYVDLYTSEIGQVTENVPMLVEWDFEAIPIGLSYEFYPGSIRKKIYPFLGIGASYFFSKVKARSTNLSDPPPENSVTTSSRDGEGYGLHVYVGSQIELTDRLLLISRLRGRYADGMAFTDKRGDIKVEFTGVDLTLGLGWRF
jgi:hypothetical protein